MVMGTRAPMRPTMRPERMAKTITASVEGSWRTPAPVGVKPCTFCMKRARNISIPMNPKLMSRPTRLAPEKVMFLKKLSWSTGLFARLSHRPNAARATAATANRATMRAEPQP